MCEISSLICRPTKRQKSSHHRSPCDLPTPPSVTGHHAWPPFNLEATGSTSYGDTHLCQLSKKTFLGFVPLLNYLLHGNLYSSIYINVHSIRWTAQLWFLQFTYLYLCFCTTITKYTILNCTCYYCCPSMCFLLLPDTSCFFFTAAKPRSFHRFLPLLCRALLGSLAMLCASCRWWWSVHHRRFFCGMTW